MGGKFKMRTPSTLSAIGRNEPAGPHSQFSQLTDSAVRQVMKAENEVPEIQYLPRDLLEPLPCNDEIYGEIRPDDAELQAAARDIAQAGIQEPLIVYKAAETGKYVILSGNRRFAASAVAKERYPEQYREYRGGLPCIVQPAPKTEQDLRKRMIKNNLQREKTPYVRMQEIAVYSQMVAQEQAREDGSTHIREVVCRDLGVSQSEVTRYLKIHSALIPPLMEAFSKQLLSTHVAHQLAGESPETQHFVCGAWSFERPLTGGDLQRLLAQRALEPYREQPKSGGRKSVAHRYQITDVREGLDTLVQRCSALEQLAEEPPSMTRQEEKKLLRKINAQLEKLDELQAALKAVREKAGE